MPKEAPPSYKIRGCRIVHPTLQCNPFSISRVRCHNKKTVPCCLRSPTVMPAGWQMYHVSDTALSMSICAEVSTPLYLQMGSWLSRHIPSCGQIFHADQTRHVLYTPPPFKGVLVRATCSFKGKIRNVLWVEVFFFVICRQFLHFSSFVDPVGCPSFPVISFFFAAIALCK